MAISKLILNGETQMDVTSNTNTSNNMLSGVVGTKNDGTSVTGSIATKTSSDLTISGATVTAPAGYYANAASKAVATATHPNPSASIASATGVVTASHTQDTGYVTGGTTTGTLNLTTQAGKTVTPTESAQTAVASYRWTTGDVNVAAISSTYVGTGVTRYSASGLTFNGSEAVVAAGYYSSNVSKYMSTGAAMGWFSFTSSTGAYSYGHEVIIAGYVSTGSVKRGQGTFTTQAAQTIYPSTKDQTIYEYRWLTGEQTIKSVTTSNLTAENIAEGVVVKVGDSANASRITQITGTHSSGDGFTVDQIATRSISGDISGNATSIGSYAFYQCTNLNTVNFPSCTSIGNYAFNSCYSLNTISFPSCTYIGFSAFAYCSSLTMASFPLCATISSYAFASCFNLTTANFSLCISIGNSAFGWCYSLNTISFPSCTYIGNYAFRSCGLITVNFPQCSIISSYAFAYCSRITTVSFPLCRSIYTYAFVDCSGLTTVNFPSCTSIGGSAFIRCGNLTTASFPSCTTIYGTAFNDCYNLLSLYLLGSSVPTLVYSTAFSSTPIAGYTTATGGVYGSIFVPSSLYNDYITATNWSLYSERIVSV